MNKKAILSIIMLLSTVITASAEIYTHIATNRLKEGMEKAAHHIGEMRRRERDKNKGPGE